MEDEGYERKILSRIKFEDENDFIFFIFEFYYVDGLDGDL